MILLSNVMPFTREDSDSTILCASFPENLANRRMYGIPQQYCQSAAERAKFDMLPPSCDVLPACCDWTSQVQSRRCRYPASPVIRAPSVRSHAFSPLCKSSLWGRSPTPHLELQTAKTPHRIQLYLNHISHWLHQTCQILMAKIPQHIRLIPCVIKLHQMAKIPPAVINRIRIVDLVWGQDRRIRSLWRATLLEGHSSGKNPSQCRDDSL
ncbi:hypothetical protein CY34DRAFT_200128 [Suillus luteus UH-Slu-Lm8-n1]|uniref:Unplaced genomic scaffold CY34scaffold_134, whole genome shotgun sequence n=1 Tax=Suillus luteus UH-Slu-Lm8-n1 TaxID=930992 RepID=A0A0D0BE20_9AGAM|nr:hypothetical protein CY34DRAFT_200128 [Suillus luteus UH-Slu-Lm8-n1]